MLFFLLHHFFTLNFHALLVALQRTAHSSELYCMILLMATIIVNFMS